MLTAVSGFLKEAGFTHSLTPARNCTFGCTYCYVPTMRIYGGLQPEDWQRWGQFTTFKPRAGEALQKELRPSQRIYCSPLVDPYQPAENAEQAMPAILKAAAAHPAQVFVIQTRGSLILRDLSLLQSVPRLRVSFSVTTDSEEIRKLYEPHCAALVDRWQTIRELRGAGIEVYATLAPLLPCNPERLIERALQETANAIIADPFHTRLTKARGATTRDAALRIAEKHGHTEWHRPDFQKRIVRRMASVAAAYGRQFGTGPAAFSFLSVVN